MDFTNSLWAKMSEKGTGRGSSIKFFEFEGSYVEKSVKIDGDVLT